MTRALYDIKKIVENAVGMFGSTDIDLALNGGLTDGATSRDAMTKYGEYLRQSFMSSIIKNPDYYNTCDVLCEYNFTDNIEKRDIIFEFNAYINRSPYYVDSSRSYLHTICRECTHSRSWKVDLWNRTRRPSVAHMDSFLHRRSSQVKDTSLVDSIIDSIINHGNLFWTTATKSIGYSATNPSFTLSIYFLLHRSITHQSFHEAVESVFEIFRNLGIQ